MVGSTWCFSGMSCPRGGKVHEYGTKSTGGTSLVKSDGMEVPLSLISCQEASFFFLGPTSDEPRVGSTGSSRREGGSTSTPIDCTCNVGTGHATSHNIPYN